MRIATNFSLEEFIDPATYKQFGESSIWFIDPIIINVAQFIRDRFKRPVTINNWQTGGNYKLSGFRPPTSKIGAKFSQHRFSRGIDIKLLGEKNKGADMIRQDIIDHWDLYKRTGLTTIEDAKFAPNWCHCDCRQTRSDELFIVKP